MTTSSKVDAYIARSPDFARPILERLRKLFHEACPDIEETIKWGCPSFEHRGMVGGFAAFKNHVTFGLWRQDVLPDPKGLFKSRGPFGSGKLTCVSQLPPGRVLIAYIRSAVKLNEERPPPRAKRKPKPAIETPPDLVAALARNRKARAAFEAFSPSHRRQYVEWITEAKREETRKKRLLTAMEWLSEGKPRNWKYM